MFRLFALLTVLLFPLSSFAGTYVIVRGGSVYVLSTTTTTVRAPAYSSRGSYGARVNTRPSTNYSGVNRNYGPATNHGGINHNYGPATNHGGINRNHGPTTNHGGFNINYDRRTTNHGGTNINRFRR